MGVTNLSETGIRVIVAGADVFDRQADRVERAINDINKAASNAGKGFGGFSISLTKIGGALTSIGTSLTKNVTLPLIGANSALTAFGISFEDAFAGVSKTIEGISVGFDEVAESIYGTSDGLTQAQKDVVFANEAFGQLTETGEGFQRWIRDTALEVPIAANELANIASLAGQMGVAIGKDGSTKDLELFTKTIAYFGIATNVTTDQAATDFAQLANILGIKSEDIATFTNMAASAIVRMGNNFAVTEGDILEITKRFGGFASAIGVLPEEIIAIGTAVLASGVKVEAGGTAIARIFEEMTFSVNDYNLVGKETAATSAQIEADLATLEQMLASGMSWDEINLAMEGTSLELTGMSKYINNLEGDFVSLDSIIETIRNNTEAKLIKALNKGTITNKEYDQSIKNMEGDLDNLRFTIQTGQRDISEFNVAFADSDLVLTGLQSQLNALDKDFTSVGDVINIVRQQSLSKMNADLAEGTEQLDLFAKAMGLSEKATVELIKQDPDLAFFKIVEGLGRMNEEGTLSSDVLQTLGLDSSRLKQLVFGLTQNTDLYQRALSFVNEEFEDQIALDEEVQKRFKTTKSLIILVKNAFQELGFILFDLQKKNIEATLNKVRDLILWFKKLDESTQRLIVTVGGIAAAIGPTLIILGQFIKYIGLSTSSIKLAANVILKQFIPILLSLAVPLLLIGALVGGVYLAFKNNFAGIQDVIKELKKTLDFAGILRPLEDFVNALKTGDISGAIDALQEAVENIFKALQSPTFRNNIKQILETFVANIGQEIENVFTNIQQSVPTLPSKITQALYPIFKQVFGPTLGKEIIKQLRFGINYALELLGAVINPIIDGIGNIFENLKAGDYSGAFESFKQIFISIFENLKNTDLIIELSGIIQEVIDKTFEDVQAAYKDPSESGLAKTITNAISTAFTEGTKALGIDDEVQKVIDKITEIFDAISPYLPLVIDPLAQGISDLVEGIIGFFNALKDVDPTILFAIGGAIIILVSQLTGRALSLIGEILPPLGEAIESFITAFSDLLKGDTVSAINEFNESLTNFRKVISKFDATLFTQLSDFFADLGVDPTAAQVIARILTVLIELSIVIITISKVVGLLTGAWGFLAVKFTLIVSKIQAVISFGSSIIGFFQGLLSSAIGAAGGLLQFAGIVAIVVGAIIAIKDNLYGVRDSFKEFIDKLKAGDIDAAIGSFIEAFQRLVIGIPTALAQILADIFGWDVDIEDTMNNLAKQIKLIWEGIKTFVPAKIEELKWKAGILWEELKNTIISKVNLVKDILSDKWEEIKTTISNKWEELKWKAGLLWDELKNTIMFNINRIKEGVPKGIEVLKENIKRKWEELKWKAEKIWEELKNNIIGKVNLVKDTLSDKWEEIKTKISDKFNEIKDKASEKVDEIVGFFTGLPGRISSAITSAFSKLLSIGASIADPIIQGFKSITHGLIDILNNAIPNSIDIDFGWPVGSINVDLPDNPIPYPPGFARGGRISGPGIVGEQGPELFLPDTSGFIVNNNILKSLISLLSPLASPSTSNITNSNMFAPTVYGVPMTNEQSMNDSILDLYWATQT